MSLAGSVPAALLRTDWRFVVLAGAATGLLASSLAGEVEPPAGWPFLIAATVVGLSLVRFACSLLRSANATTAGPGGSSSPVSGLGPAVRKRPASRALRLAMVGIAATLAGLWLGADRIAAIDRGAVPVADGSSLATLGFVTSPPRTSRGSVSFRIHTPQGNLLVRTQLEIPELLIGREVAVGGMLSDPEPWRVASLRRHGIAAVLEARRVELTGARRSGLVGRLDQVRDRAESALERGMAAPEAALARGFVLGQDDRIDPRTVDDFKRSGLAHLLAVSGQNVLLLALLAMPMLAALRLGLRARLAAVLLLIAVYVPVAGAGPSIQRAGVMAAAGIVATLAGRLTSRTYAVLLAAFITLAINPRAGGEIGWQLSFAAVIGILLWAPPLRDLVLNRLGRGDRAVSPARRALAEGFGMTVAATIATAPLMALHFDSVPLAALPANLLALPAVAPVMWLGMITSAAGQLPGFPVEPINALNGVLIGYIAQIARWLAAPDWAVLSVPISGATGVALAYGTMLGVGALVMSAARRRASLAVRRRVLYAAVAGLALIATIALARPGGASLASSEPGSLTVTVLDVGQGDAILLDPPGGEPVLVDTGPPEAEIAQRLDRAGIDRLAALVVTHDQLDHSGGVDEVLGGIEVEALVQAAAAPSLGAIPAATKRIQIAAGDTLRSGALELEALWPPPSLIESEASDPNRSSLVLLARWQGFSMLLTGDAEAEAAPVSPGRFDVLKVAHHGSEDSGLPGLLAQSAPAAAVISVGAGNRHGHPAPATIGTLDLNGVATFRTDIHGDTRIVVDSAGWEIHTASSR